MDHLKRKCALVTQNINAAYIKIPKSSAANTVGRTLENISKTDSYSELFLTYKCNVEHSPINYSCDSSSIYNSPFTEKELLNSIQSCHRHLLVGENPPNCPHCHFLILIIHHLLMNCPGLHHLYRLYFKSSLPNLKSLLGEKPRTGIVSFLKEANFYYYI